MPYYFPIPNITSGFQDLLIYSNTVTSNLFSSFLLIGLFLILFLGMKTRGFQTEKVFASASFSTTLVSYIMLLIPGFISPDIIVIMTMITAVSVIFLYKTGSSGGTYWHNCMSLRSLIISTLFFIDSCWHLRHKVWFLVFGI